MAPPAQAEPQRPAVIINQETPSSWRPQARTDGAPVYLIALADGVIWAATAYWMDDGTLHFVTTKNERRSTPLSQLDRELTERLNRERGVDIRIQSIQ
jgi:hypothetical protein